MGRLVVRDGRGAGDPAFVSEEEGEILVEFDDERLWALGDRLRLPNGEEVRVLGYRQFLTGSVWTADLIVGDLGDQ